MSDTTLYPARQRLASTWQLARLAETSAQFAPTDWIPATVPGGVQLDWARPHDLPDYNHGQNVHAWAGLEDFHWLYRTTVPATPIAPDQRLFFTAGGVDYQCEVRLDGRTVQRHTGFFTPFEIDVTDVAPGTALEILILPAPKLHAEPADRSQATHVTKPAVSYGWDWHPRLITLGLGDETGFELRPAAHLRHVDFDYVLADDFSFADITVTAETSTPAAATWHLLDPAGKRVLTGHTGTTARLPNPQLWWTHDQGAPALYTLEVTLGGGDTKQSRVGFRRVRLVMHAGAWDYPADFPKTRSHPPITLELNGRVVFAKGTNWVNPEVFHGTITADTYRPLLDLARDAHFNLLRCWGGAPVAKTAFFEQCDALGLLVWQEFPLACNPYPDTPDYLALLDQESRAIIRRVRQHPCLGLWVGGNELFNAWSGMDDQGLPLRLLNRNCYDLDPRTPFLPTSPVGGMGHGDYRFRDDRGRDVFQIFQQAENTAYTEFGCCGPSPVDYVKTFIPKAELWPPAPGTSWETHHAFGAWDIDLTSWFGTQTIEHYFGSSNTLKQLIGRGEWLQCEGYRSIYEEARRQKPRCSMALNWCYNEPWPSAANNSLINWPARPKPAYYAVQGACRTVLASARIPKFQWHENETFSAELWLLNDAPGPLPAGELTAHLEGIGTSPVELVGWTFGPLPANTNLAGPTVRLPLTTGDATEFTLVLTVTGQPDWTSRYRLSVCPDPHRKEIASGIPRTRTLNT